MRNVEYTVLKNDGSRFPAEITTLLVTNVESMPKAFLSVMRDITERKQAEEKIHEQAALLDKAQDAIGVVDLDSRILYWNKGAERLYGWTAEGVIGKKAREFLYKKEPPERSEARRSVLEKGEWSGELHQVTKDGKEVIVQSRWSLVRDNEGKSTSILIINADITEKKLLEEQLLRVQRLESLGTLAGGIAHDLNNVLQPIVMVLAIFRKKFTDEQSQHLIEMVENSAQRGADIIKQVLTFARGAEGEYIVLQPKHLIREMDQIARGTFPKFIQIVTDIPKDLWLVSGNATQLHQVLMNLCVNARDAMPDGGRLTLEAKNVVLDEVFAHMHVDAVPGAYVVMMVSDTGTGIPPAILDKIFDPFFTTKGIGKGTGLGLSTVHAIVKSHDGFMEVESKVDQGTQFKVYLPVAGTVGVQHGEPIHVALPVGHGEVILVVDDEAAVRDITKGTLEVYGYRVLTATDGTEGLAMYAEHREEIAIVLMDIMMPYMGGAATVWALRGVNPQVKVILMSGLTEEHAVTDAVAAGVQAFLRKPYTAEELLKLLHEILQSK
jgi:PAS domain S-box-containing protein